MQKMIRSYTTLGDLIVKFKRGEIRLDTDFCLYSKDAMDPLTSETTVWIDEYPREGVSGEDVLPNDVVNNCLELCYYGEQFLDVLNNVFYQKKENSVDTYITALNYYMDHDDFMDIT
ncbi:hypothetical protein BZJ17_14770 [Salinivibrio sp. IB574]|uniref:DUF7716 domain-containing protein n=1 Tax=Salinivibrio sp. IB574 TaxID=1909444 RepID=UPI000988E1D6|nr:hypothetical protein [Salinivibrio sp. IB574]OOF19855.1 hypothetical protein BZJ17_14770 [Salinivibrio sp. IB574]